VGNLEVFRSLSRVDWRGVMSAQTHHFAEILTDDEGLLEGFLALETPLGFKAELIEGEIVVTPPPDGSHETVIGRIVKQVFWNRIDVDFAGQRGLIVPAGRYIPDGTFAVSGSMRGDASWVLPDGVLMVLEVTSSRPTKDRETKRRGYAAAGIPLYLLVDRQRDKLILHSVPENGDYVEILPVPVGDPLDLPAPFSFTLDTSGLV
jgi:Uma2 family endonuclease